MLGSPSQTSDRGLLQRAAVLHGRLAGLCLGSERQFKVISPTVEMM
jgi:hypothetical protein